MDKLTYLTQFYDVEGYEDWEKDDKAWTGDASERDDSSSSELTLEDAVQRYPDKALRALAMKLGLEYRGVTRCMESIENREQLQALMGAKRPQDSEDSGREAKIAKIAAANSPPRHSSSFLKQLLMTASEEMRHRKGESKRSDSEYVYWEDLDAVETRARLLRIMAARSVKQQEALLEGIEQLSRSEQSAPKQSAAEQPRAVQWTEGSPTQPYTTSSRKSSESQSGQASERAEE